MEEEEEEEFMANREGVGGAMVALLYRYLLFAFQVISNETKLVLVVVRD